jgi:hypothetical protein
MRSSAKVESIWVSTQAPFVAESMSNSCSHRNSLYGYRSYTCCKDNRTQMCVSIIDGFTYSGDAVSICFNRWSIQAYVADSKHWHHWLLSLPCILSDWWCMQPISWVPELGSFEKGSATCTAVYVNQRTHKVTCCWSVWLCMTHMPVSVKKVSVLLYCTDFCR